ncbi:histidine kinase dimerization/phospho-acceptor domain-containing protein [Sphingomonas sp.]|uniref:histidine kinase dimerization/phospho-acceptor domain-containing protein n=1 Tax=Sphingomonas sp. TaxID=28214 RepID=UPI002DD651F9|nr:sensor histidine kinase [Sphingomonas sp.]
MRFDDILDTVRAADTATPASRAAMWRQLVDLVGRGRVSADWAIARLAELRDLVSADVRAASARALFGASPPPALVRLFVQDEIAIAAPLLRSAVLAPADWIALLPSLTPTARAVLRHRRDLGHEVEVALASFGSVDFVIAGDSRQDAVAIEDTVPAADPAAPATSPDTGPFVAVGKVALGLPVVAEALGLGNDNEVPSGEGTFRIADVVARLEAFQRRQEQQSAPASTPDVATGPDAETAFRFETDDAGVIRRVDGISRGAVIGMEIARAAQPGGIGADGIASGAFRRRARFSDARLLIGGEGAAAGTWLISATPGFEASSGRFTGYRGSGRRPLPHEALGAASVAPPFIDALRQLVHELRTPTNAIAGFSEMIEHQLLGPVIDAHRDQAVLIRSDAGGVLAAIDDLDTAARLDGRALTLRAETVPLAPLLAGVADGLAGLVSARRAELRIAGADAGVHADPIALERLVSRLLGALIGAAGEGEVVTVTVGGATGELINMTIDRPASLAGRDTAALYAIDDEDSPATLLGLGFALRLVRNLARELGGGLEIEAGRVVLTLPAAQANATGRATSRT